MQMKKLLPVFFALLLVIVLVINLGCDLVTNLKSSTGSVVPTVGGTSTSPGQPATSPALSTSAPSTTTVPASLATQTVVLPSTASLAPIETRYLNPLQIAQERWYEANQGPVTYQLSQLISTIEGNKYYAPYAMCFDGRYLLVACRAEGRIFRIDPYYGDIKEILNPGLSEIYDICFDGHNLWIISRSLNTIQQLYFFNDSMSYIRIPASSGRVTASKGPSAICFDGRYVWVANDGTNTLLKMSTGNKGAGALVATYTYDASEINSPADICFDGIDLWVTNAGNSTVSRIDPTSGACTGTYKVGQNPKGVCFDGANIWVANSGSGTVSRLRTIGLPIGTYNVAAGPKELCFDGENIWVASPETNKVTKLRADDGKLIATYDVINPVSLCFDGANMWVAQNSDNSLRKL
jgi:YVTN family beta-propeller protein